MQHVPVPARIFDAATFLAFISPEKKALYFPENKIIFSEGERSDSIFYIEKGAVKLTATSRKGKEAIIGVFSEGDFFGESCLASDQPLRFHTAVALTDIHALKIDRAVIIRALIAEGHICYGFVTYLLRRNTGLQKDLVSNLVDSSEERLARALFRLSKPVSLDLPAKVSQQTLAEMIGTTRQRVNLLMKHFKHSGLIEYANGLKIRNSLRSVFRGE
jgi:CRP-like cAMP-binding protein